MICCYHTIGCVQMHEEILPKFLLCFIQLYCFTDYSYVVTPCLKGLTFFAGPQWDIVLQFNTINKLSILDTCLVVWRDIEIHVWCEIIAVSNPGYRVYTIYVTSTWMAYSSVLVNTLWTINGFDLTLIFT